MSDPDYKRDEANRRTKQEFKQLIDAGGIDNLNQMFENPDNLIDIAQVQK
ncbi:MAG: hypothetical protein HC771_13065 [Synechococcales cyanobacterium CRU_2_2]|nr:hypothetical protein [Synechococcales cyanobacterium CRU_2_2]